MMTVGWWHKWTSRGCWLLLLLPEALLLRRWAPTSHRRRRPAHGNTWMHLLWVWSLVLHGDRWLGSWVEHSCGSLEGGSCLRLLQELRLLDPTYRGSGVPTGCSGHGCGLLGCHHLLDMLLLLLLLP